MTPVLLSKKGGARWITQHYGINGWKLQPMIIPRCARCTGVFIFWKTIFPKAVAYSVTAGHIPPMPRKYTREIQKDLLKNFHDGTLGSEPYLIVFCGGRIDTPQNKYWYKLAAKRYVQFADRVYKDIPVMVVVPNKTTTGTNLYLHEDGSVSARFYIP
jgi:hypothetical protein